MTLIKCDKSSVYAEGIGKALTYAEKYFLLKQFNIPTDNDDPDSFQQRSDQSVPNFLNESQIRVLDVLLKDISELTGTPIDDYLDHLILNH